MADLFTLSASLLLDTSSFTSSLSGAEGALQSLATGDVWGAVAKIGVSTISGLAGAAWDFAKDVVNTGMEVGKTYSNVQAILGESDETMARLKQTAISEASETIYTVNTVGKAYENMAYAGWDASQIMAGLPGVLDLAAASNTDLSTATTIVVDALSQFNLEASESERFANVLASVSANSNTRITDLGNAFKYTGTIAGQLGFSIEDVATSLGLMANSGIRGTMAGTAFRNILTRIVTDTGATSTKLGAMGLIVDELGVSLYDSTTNKLRPWNDILVDCRAAWAGLDEETANSLVTEAFADFADTSQSATEVLASFTTQLDEMQAEYNSLEGTEQENYIKQFASQFEQLGIQVTDASGNYRDLNDIITDTKTRLGLLTETEKVSYANRISGLRGMAAWLALMNATEDSYNNVRTAAVECQGAAENMANTQLDNLWGDVEKLNGKLYTLKTLLFDEINTPLRAVVQWANNAIQNITNALQKDGLEGAISALADEITKAADNLVPVARAFGTALAPLVTAMIDEIMSMPIDATKITLFITRIVSAFNVGLTNYSRENPGAFSFLSTSLLSVFSIDKLIQQMLGFDTSSQLTLGSYTATTQAGNVAGGGGGTFVSGLAQSLQSSEPIAMEFSIDPEILMNEIVVQNQLRGAIEEATKNGIGSIKINGLVFNTEDLADNLYQGNLSSYISDALANGGAAGTEALINIVKNLIPGEVGNTIGETLSNAGENGGFAMVSNIISNVISGTGTVLNTISDAITEAGYTGGNQAMDNIHTITARGTTYITNTLSDGIGAAGGTAASKISSDIRNALSTGSFIVNVVGTLVGIFGGQRNYASAMHSGKILKGATVFGMNDSGEALVGGEAGAEVVAGTDSLSKLITGAVNAARNNSTNTTINIYQQPGESAEALAERVQRVLAREQRQRRTVYA